MNFLAIKRLTSNLLLLSKRLPSQFVCMQSHAAFSNYEQTSLNMTTVVNNFYARGEAEEVSVTSIAKTMGDILKTQFRMTDHLQYKPISEELAYYVVKLLQQNKKPYVSHSQAKTFLDFGTTFDVQDREYWGVVIASLQEALQDMKSKDLLSMVSQLKHFGLLNTQLLSQALLSVKDQI